MIRHLMAAAAAMLAWQAAAFDLQGHRGARGLAPENTLAAFDRALAVGVHTLELDTVVTRDDVVVVSHDRSLNPDMTRDATGRFLDAPGPAIRTLTLAELKRYDVGRLKEGTRYAQSHPEQRSVDGERIPTLAEVFERVKQRGATGVRFNIETKITPQQGEPTPDPDTFAALLLAAIDRAGMRERVTVQSFDWRTLAAVQRLAPGVPTAYLSAQQSWLNNVPGIASVPRAVADARGSIWSPYFGDLTADSLAEARRLGLRVLVWTVNAPADIERMLDLGVDGIISDRPDRVRDAMARRGMALPPRHPG